MSGQSNKVLTKPKPSKYIPTTVLISRIEINLYLEVLHQLLGTQNKTE